MALALVLVLVWCGILVVTLVFDGLERLMGALGEWLCG